MCAESMCGENRGLGFQSCGFCSLASGWVFGCVCWGHTVRLSSSGFQGSCSEFRIPDFGFRVSVSGVQVQGFGFQVSGSGFRVSGLES